MLTPDSDTFFDTFLPQFFQELVANLLQNLSCVQLKSPPKQWKRVGGGRKQLRWMIQVQEWGAIDDAWRESRLLGSTVNFTVEHPKLTGEHLKRLGH